MQAFELMDRFTIMLKHLLIAFLLSGLPGLLAADDLAVSHTLSFPQREMQYLRVNLRMPVEGEFVELAMPSWTPGSYLIRDYAAHVERLQVSDSQGGYREVRKVAKNRWRIDTAGISEVTVNYDVWAGNLGVNFSWVEPKFALVNGASVFLYSDASRSMPQHVAVNLPADWRSVHTSLVPAQGAEGWTAADFDELVDSPILAGNAQAYRFELEGQSYALVNEGDTTLWDGTQAAQDVAAIVKAVQSFWGIDPLEREYLFLNLLVEGRGGLEHDHSTVMLASHWQMRYREDYVRWLALVTHEFFHSWNVRRMRPQALASYDYDREVYTRELWLAEGLTSYYDNLLLFRSGLITVNEFLELLADEIHKLDTTPGREVRSLELASFDTWIKQYRPDANSINSSVSYYRKGSVVGFVIDTRLRSQSSNKLSLDVVMSEMYRRYAGGSYPPGAFEALIEQLAGPETGSWVKELLKSTSDPDLDSALDWYGLELDRGANSSATDSEQEPAAAGFGLIWDKSKPLLIVESVIRDGAGATAGVLPGDELLAINGSRVQKGQIADRMARLVPGEQVELTLVRYGQLFTLPLIVQQAIPDKYVISLKSRFRDRDRRRLEVWLGRDLTLTR